MPTFDVTVTKRMRLAAPDFGAAADTARKIEAGELSRPDSISVMDVAVTKIEAR